MDDNNPINLTDKTPESVGDTLANSVMSYRDYPSVVKVKEKTVFTKAEKILALGALVTGYGIVQFALMNTTGFFTTALFLIIISLTIAYLKKTGHSFKTSHKIWTIVMITFSTVFSLTANDMIKTLDLIFLVLAGAYLVYGVCAEKDLFGRFTPCEILKSSVTDPLRDSVKEYSALASIFKRKNCGAAMRSVLGGIILAVPLTIVVSVLLVSADQGFENYFISFFSFLEIFDIMSFSGKLILSFLVAGYLFGLFFYHTRAERMQILDEESCIDSIRKFRIVSNTTVYVAVTPICLLYVLFFISQANYFLAAFMNRLPADLSYAQYARRGFFELFAIELINAGVIFFINFFSKKTGEEKTFTLSFYSVMISVFTLLITATAISKMVLYIRNYGLTQLRVYTTWFMVLTAFSFVYVIVRQFKQNFAFMRASAITFTFMFALLCFSRPDAIIARYNMEYCSEHLTLHDIIEMNDLSSDAAAVITEDRYKDIIDNKYMDDKYASKNYVNKGTTGSEYINNRCEQQLGRSEYNNYNISTLKLKGQISK